MCSSLFTNPENEFVCHSRGRLCPRTRSSLESVRTLAPQALQLLGDARAHHTTAVARVHLLPVLWNCPAAVGSTSSSRTELRFVPPCLIDRLGTVALPGPASQSDGEM